MYHILVCITRGVSCISKLAALEPIGWHIRRVNVTGEHTNFSAAELLAPAQVEGAAMVVACEWWQRCDQLVRPCRRRAGSPYAERKWVDVGRCRRRLVEGVVPLQQALEPVYFVRCPSATRGASDVRVEPRLVREHGNERDRGAATSAHVTFHQLAYEALNGRTTAGGIPVERVWWVAEDRDTAEVSTRKEVPVRCLVARR